MSDESKSDKLKMLFDDDQRKSTDQFLRLVATPIPTVTIEIVRDAIVISTSIQIVASRTRRHRCARREEKQIETTRRKLTEMKGDIHCKALSDFRVVVGNETQDRRVRLGCLQRESTSNIFQRFFFVLLERKTSSFRIVTNCSYSTAFCRRK